MSWRAVVPLLLFAAVAVSSCQRQRPPHVSHIHVTLPLYRFEQELFSLSRNSTDSALHALAARYNDFFWFYFLDFGIKPTDTAWADSLRNYVADTLLQALNDSVQRQFGDFGDYHRRLQRLFQYARHYFPDAPVPALVTLINGPGRAAFTYGDTLLCISLDDYLGPASRFYRHQDIPRYLLRRFRPEYLLPHCAHVWITQQFAYNYAGKNLLDAMIYNGKVLYVKSRLLPELPDSLIAEFRQVDLEWCRRNEPLIWKFFLDRDLLYEQDLLNYLKYVTDGPNTSGMPPEAPGNIGTWVGWRIVSAYMKRHPTVTLQQLMTELPAQQVLDGAAYKPR